MQFERQDFVRLRSSLGLFAALATLGGSAIGGTRYLLAQETQEYARVQAQQHDMRQRLARIREEADELRQKIDRYPQLLASDYLRAEHRIAWIERIAQIQAERHLGDIRYELAPQKPLDPAALPGNAGAARHEFMVSTMTLQIALLHEGELLGFIDALAGSVNALLQVRHCNLEPNPDGHAFTPLKADCSIDWITLREKA